MTQACPKCGKEVLDIDVKCASCGAGLGASGAHRMIGSVMLGQYELVDVLGQGGMSVVFKGRHKLTEQEVALKILPPELAAHSQVKSRFLDEAKALAALDHQNIVHLYNFGQENGSFVLAMQLVQGRTWERMILESQRLDWPTSVRVCVDVLRALEYAHGRGVIHRDMKPSNVLVRAQDGSATVMDFGIAKMTTSTRLTATGQTMGTVRYMSPEQVRGQEVDLRTDIYSLGATLYESLTGETPFDGNTHFEIMTKHLSEIPRRPSLRGIEVPRDIEDALMRALAKRPEDRFDTARDMRKLFEQILRDNDLGLVETQRLSRELVSEVRAEVRAEVRPETHPEPPTLPLPIALTPRTPPPVRMATANDLADELEPGGSGVSPAAARRRRLWPFLAIGTAVAAGAVGATLVLLPGRAGYRPTVKVEGVTLTAGQRFGAVLVETDGEVSPDEVWTIYQKELAALRDFAAQKAPKLDIPDPLTEIIAMPQAAMCLKRNWGGMDPPKDCALSTSVTLFGPQNQHRMFAVSDRTQLVDAIRRGVAQAACDLQLAGPTPADQQRQAQVCELTEQFIQAGVR
ncbi:MAG TPA: serine/threonine-protein kinase [Kofleriaceae bacterium]|nr:serine/threonine-protein kinase [Kofleriaceae bacterium]